MNQIISRVEGDTITAAVGRLEARGVSRSKALRRVARAHGSTVRYVRQAQRAGRGSDTWLG